MDVFLSPSELLGRAEELLAYQKASKVAPRYFLLYHTIELILKAYIAWRRRITADELKTLFGYDLVKLVDEAIRLGLNVNPSAENDIQKLIEARAEYVVHPEEAANRVLVIEYLVERDIDQLLKAVRQKMAIRGY
jgi:hypothetical protein